MAGETILVRLRTAGAAKFKRDMDSAGHAAGDLEPKGRAGARGLRALEDQSVTTAGALRALAVVAVVTASVQGIGFLITAVGAAAGVLAGLGASALGTLGVLGLFAAGAQAYFKDLSAVSGSAASALADNFNYLKAQAFEALGPGFDAVFKGLSKAMEPLASLIQALAPAFNQLGAVLGEAAVNAVKLLQSMGPQFAQLIRGSGAVVQVLVPLFGELLRIFLEAAQAGLPYLIEGIQKLTGALRGVSGQDVAGFIARSFQTMGDAFRTVVALVRLVGPVFSALRQSIQQIATAALPGLTRGIEALGPAFEAILASGALATIAGAIGDTFGFIATVVSKVATELQKYGLLGPVVTGITAAFVAWKIAIIAANIALAANPVVLIIGAIAALVVGVIYAYRRFEGFRDAVDGAWGVIKSVADWIRNNWATALGLLTGPVGIAVGFIIDRFGGIKSVVRGVASAIVAPFKGAFNAIASLWNSTIGKVHFKIPGWVPGIGGKGFDVPDIPMLAKGGTIAAGGMALVGERGPELVTLPTGATVSPNGSAATQGVINGGSPFATPARNSGPRTRQRTRTLQPINLTVNGRTLSEVVAEVMMDDEYAGNAA